MDAVQTLRGGASGEVSFGHGDVLVGTHMEISHGQLDVQFLGKSNSVLALEGLAMEGKKQTCEYNRSITMLCSEG